MGKNVTKYSNMKFWTQKQTKKGHTQLTPSVFLQ